MEAGPNTTFFEPRPIAAELALCQRYFYRHGGVANELLGTGWFRTSSDIRSSYLYPVTMRAAPTISPSALSHLNIEHGVTASAVVTFAAYSITPRSAQFSNTPSGTPFTPGDSGSVVLNTAAGFIDFDAEL